MSFRAGHSWVAFSLALLCACASAPVKPGTGDVSFRLRWEGEADLDLHVLDPGGRATSALSAFSVPQSPAVEAQMIDGRLVATPELGEPGVLDIDCNAAPDRICQRPIENVYWPTGSAPIGTYSVWVELFQKLRDGSRIAFEIEVRRGETVVETYSGEVHDEEPHSPQFSYAFAPERPVSR